MKEEFYYMRHGWSHSKIEGRLDHSKLGFSPEGVSQVKEKREAVQKLGIQRVFSSPVARARETAEILFPHNTIEIVSEISECSFEVWEAISEKKATKEKEAYLEKFSSGFERIKKDLFSEKSLIVDHGGNFWAFSQILGLSFELLKPSEIVRFFKESESWKFDRVFLF